MHLYYIRKKEANIEFQNFCISFFRDYLHQETVNKSFIEQRNII